MLSEQPYAHSGWISSVAFSPDGTKIVSGSGDKKIKVWDSGALEPSKSPLLGQHWRLLACLAGKLELLSEKTNAHSSEIESVAFSPDGTKIVSGSGDKTIKVWDIVNWSRKDHLLFNVTTQRFVLLMLWLNKYSMAFPDDVIDLLIVACLKSKWGGMAVWVTATGCLQHLILAAHRRAPHMRLRTRTGRWCQCLCPVCRGLSERGASKPKRAARTCQGEKGFHIHTTLTRHAWHINLPN
jgi:WD40 repeat protein